MPPPYSITSIDPVERRSTMLKPDHGVKDKVLPKPVSLSPEEVQQIAAGTAVLLSTEVRLPGGGATSGMVQK
jgi:hypothetical protein